MARRTVQMDQADVEQAIREWAERNSFSQDEIDAGLVVKIQVEAADDDPVNPHGPRVSAEVLVVKRGSHPG